MSDERNGGGKARLDRLEGLMELLIDDHLKFADEHKRLLTAQVLLTEAQQLTERRIQELAATQAAVRQDLAELQKHSDERLNALIKIVDDLIRNRPPQPPQ
jgi:hypothetical protein